MSEKGAEMSWIERTRGGFPAIVVGLVCIGAIIRISVALAAPVFSEFDAIGLFRSDPALLLYVTERIVDNGGLPPDDFRADPRIEHPETSDIPAMFTVGQEFLVAWSYLLLGFGVPLHLFALVLMSLIASTAVVGIAGLTRELTGSKAWASLAGLVYVVTAGSYRTIGIILIREDLSLPLFTLHLYLLARALRLRTPAAIAAAALAAVAALSTWHAMSFVFTVEVACIFAWWLRTGENPLADRSSWIGMAVLVAGGLLVPVLQSKLFVLSLSMQMLTVMAAAPILARVMGEGALRRVMVGVAGVVVAGGLCAGLKAWIAPGSGDYTHVVEMMLAKVWYLGALPRDPDELSFGARLLWAGVFETSNPQALLVWLGALAFLTPVSGFDQLGSWWRGRGDGRQATLAAFGVAALVLALMVKRLFALAALVSPVLAILLLRSSFSPRASRSWVAALVLVQAIAASSVVDNTMLQSWYNPVLMRQLASTLHYIRDELPGEGAIATDFVTSSAVLARTAHASVLQPKYETRRSRDRIERFLGGLYRTSPPEFRKILRQELGARYLLVDMRFLWKSRYMAGVPLDAPSPPTGSAAARLLSPDRSTYSTVPGYRLLYESHPRGSRYRLYDLAAESSADSSR